jgi:hypothetical protein
MAEHERMPVLTGGCQCGAVRYALFALPAGSICHCRMCQKAVGGPFAALATVDPEDLAWTRGSPASFRSSSLATRGFCAACGTPLTYQGLDRPKIEVTICSLDEPDAVAPASQFGVESRIGWLAALPALPAAVTHARYAGLVSHQHPDHET